MALTVNTNLAAMRSQRNLNANQWSLNKTFERVSSGRRINSAADDAAGLAVAENLDASVRSLGAARRNVNDGLGLIQVAEGASVEVGNILKRMRELAIQAASDTLGDSERAYIQFEVDQLVSEVERIAGATDFNGVVLADANNAAYLGSLDIQVGINNVAGVDQLTLSLGSLNASAIELDGGTFSGDITGVDLSTAATARTSLADIDVALDAVSEIRAHFGALSNRLDSAGRNIDQYSLNLRASESQIRDADFAVETANLSKQQVIQQAGISVLGQANNISQGVVQLLG